MQFEIDCGSACCHAGSRHHFYWHCTCQVRFGVHVRACVCVRVPFFLAAMAVFRTSWSTSSQHTIPCITIYYTISMTISSVKEQHEGRIALTLELACFRTSRSTSCHHTCTQRFNERMPKNSYCHEWLGYAAHPFGNTVLKRRVQLWGVLHT